MGSGGATGVRRLLRRTRAARPGGAELATRTLRLQGCYYLAGGAWQLLHERSFEAVSGPKPDLFQTRVTSALFCAAGLALLTGARRPPDATATVLAVGSALGVAAVDWRHRHTIRPIFRAEAALEVVFAAAALAGSPPWSRRRRVPAGLPREVVVRGGFDPPTFRFSGGRSSN